MRRRGFTTRAAIAAAVVVGGLAGAGLSGIGGERGGAASATQALPQAVAEAATLGVAGRSTSETVRRLEQVVRRRPEAAALTRLGFAYQVRWRETGDPSYLPQAETALTRAAKLGGETATTSLGLGSLALTRHDFRRALVLGRQAVAAAPYTPAAYGVVGDALLELGRYGEAFATFEKMVAIKPTLAGYARIAYARELRGDRAGALAAMKLALESAGGVPEPSAWTLVEIAKLELGSGRPGRAGRAIRAAQTIFPGYPYAGEELARLLAAQGDLTGAIREARRASAAIPLPSTVSLLGSLLERAGQSRAAQRQFATVGAIDRLLAANGIAVDLDSALYRADRGIAPRATVVLARQARLVRPSIAGDDTLGWALARAGRCRDAESWLDRALRLGTRDALLYFHRGYAAGCAGDRAAMRAWYRKALALNPAFSVQWSPVAKEAVS
ncbi:MAG: tetratricopeptide repeat protein [Gaiellales bacterium]